MCFLTKPGKVLEKEESGTALEITFSGKIWGYKYSAQTMANAQDLKHKEEYQLLFHNVQPLLSCQENHPNVQDQVHTRVLFHLALRGWMYGYAWCISIFIFHSFCTEVSMIINNCIYLKCTI